MSNPANIQRGQERRIAIRALLKAGKRPTEIAKLVGISKQQFYTHLGTIRREDAEKQEVSA